MPGNGSDSIRNDILLIVSLLVFALVLFAFRSFYYKWNADKAGTGDRVLVTVDGRSQGTYPLLEDDQIRIRGEGWTNTLLIRDGTARISEADCPDKICVRHAAISRTGENIVCLPHKLVVEIIAGEGEEEDSIDAVTR